jgi:hypothetical protein
VSRWHVFIVAKLSLNYLVFSIFFNSTQLLLTEPVWIMRCSSLHQDCFSLNDLFYVHLYHKIICHITQFELSWLIVTDRNKYKYLDFMNSEWGKIKFKNKCCVLQIYSFKICFHSNSYLSLYSHAIKHLMSGILFL